MLVGLEYTEVQHFVMFNFILLQKLWYIGVGLSIETSKWRHNTGIDLSPTVLLLSSLSFNAISYLHIQDKMALGLPKGDSDAKLSSLLLL